MVFKVQDGIEFATRADWRNYMMLTYYSFHDVKDSKEPLIKNPGSINGQMFDIINCVNSELIILDSCEQVQIDNAKNCRIFIGASTSTVFIRKCQDCVIYSCCSQLRIRECVDCVHYVYSLAEVHIEESSHLQFACFNGGYPEHEAHLKECNLFPVEVNFWHSVYDHNAPARGEEMNWKLLPQDQCEAWFPVGACDRAVPLTAANTSVGVSNHHQVGEAFGIEQMKLDAEKLKRKSSKGNEKTSSSEASRPGRSTKSSGSAAATSSTQEFSFDEMVLADSKKQQDKKHVTLSVSHKSSPPPASTTTKQLHTPSPTAVTPLPSRYLTDKDEEKVNLLGIEIALLVASARAKGIDVSVWLSESAPNHIVLVSDFNTRFISLGLAVGIQEDFDTKREIDFATDANSLTSIATICSEGFSQRDEPLLNVRTFLMLAQAKVDRFMQQGMEGRVDQEVEEEEEEEEEVMDSPAVEKPVVVPEPVIEPVPVPEPVLVVEVKVEVEPEEEPLRPAVTASVEEPLPQPRPRPRATRSTSAPPRQRKSVESLSSSGLHLRGFARQSLTGTTLESLLVATLKQPDMYHIIQVHLGYIKPYVMNLARGSVVVSSPRRWISVYDIEKAFSAARLHLNNSQIQAVMQNVNDFATSTGLDPIRTVDNEKEQGALEEALTTQSVVVNQRVSSVWLKRYLVHLKLGVSACDWVTWLDTKLSDKEYRRSMKMTTSDKSKEFRKALAGMPHTLGDKETSEMLQKFDILTPEVLEQEVQHRVDNWELDTAGRRDFHHLVNVQYKRWTNEKENSAAMAGKSRAARGEEEKKVKREIKQKLLREKKQELLLSEKKRAAITIDMFMKFDAENKKDNYTNSKKFGDWLDKHMSKEAQHLNNFRQDEKTRNQSFGSRQVTDSWLGSLTHIESLASKVIVTLKPPLQHERRKSLIALRRQVMNDMRACNKENKESQHLLVSRKLFNQHFEDRSFLTKIEEQLAADTPGEAGACTVFFRSKDEATRSAHDFDKSCAEERSEHYQRWLDKTNEVKKKEASKRVTEEQLKEQADKKKSSRAEKVFNKWVRLHKTNKYYSKTEKKAKAIPEVLRASHKQSWRQEQQQDSHLDLL